jgi:hypothetical protein
VLKDKLQWLRLDSSAVRAEGTAATETYYSEEVEKLSRS